MIVYIHTCSCLTVEVALLGIYSVWSQHLSVFGSGCMLPFSLELGCVRLSCLFVSGHWQMAVVLAGGYERWHTFKEQRFYLLVDACRKRTVRYVNFIGHFTDAHGSWDYDFDSGELVIEFNHWGSLGSLRKCVLRRSPTLDPVYDSTCFEHVCFEGKDYLGRMIYIRLGSWTRYPSEGIFPDGTADPQYWARDPVTVLAIMSSYGRPCGYRVRNTSDRLDLSYPLQLSVRTRELIDTLNLAIFYPLPTSRL